jgi:hypothetical protein
LTSLSASRITSDAVRFLDKLPLTGLILVAVVLSLAPFAPEPHLWEKLKLLSAGMLTRPIDILDLVMHGAPWLLVAAKRARMAQLRARAERAAEGVAESSNDAS